MASIKAKYFCTNKCFVNIFQIFKFVKDHPATQLFSPLDQISRQTNYPSKIRSGLNLEFTNLSNFLVKIFLCSSGLSLKYFKRAPFYGLKFSLLHVLFFGKRCENIAFSLIQPKSNSGSCWIVTLCYVRRCIFRIR